jgi:hypothetical protein
MKYILIRKKFSTKVLFGSRESGGMESRKEGKFMGKCASTVWFACQRGRKGLNRWAPRLKTFSPRLSGKHNMENKLVKSPKCPWF